MYTRHEIKWNIEIAEEAVSLADALYMKSYYSKEAGLNSKNSELTWLSGFTSRICATTLRIFKKLEKEQGEYVEFDDETWFLWSEVANIHNYLYERAVDKNV